MMDNTNTYRHSVAAADRARLHLRRMNWGDSLLLQAGQRNSRVPGFCCCWGLALPLGLSLGLLLGISFTLPGMLPSIEALGMLSLLGMLSVRCDWQSFTVLLAVLWVNNRVTSLSLQMTALVEQVKMLHCL